MGVKNLKAFIKTNKRTSEYKLSSSYLVIDGKDLLFEIYHKSMNCLYGGNYNEFEDYLCHFFDNLQKCKVTPLVILRGSTTKNEYIMNRNFNASNDKNKALLHVAKYHKFDDEFGSCKIIPFLAYESMLSIMKDRDIAFTQCDFNDLNEIAVIAKAFQCPVLSRNSHFYIFDMPNGFIPIDSLEIEAIKDINGECFYMPCRIYHLDMFLSYYPRLQKEVLPIFSFLLRKHNADDTEVQEHWKIIELFPKNEPGYFSLESVLEWLEGKTYNEVIQHFYTILQESSRDKIISMIQDVTNMYKIEYSSCLPYLCNVLGVEIPHCINCDETDILPRWFLEKIRSGYFALNFIQIISQKSVIIPTQLEYLFFDSSHKCSRYLLNNIYSIINYVKPIGRIKEYIRDGITFNMEEIDINLQQLNLGQNFRNHGSLDGLDDIFYQMIKIDKEFELKFPPKISNVFLSIVYWIRNAFPKVTEHQLDAVILTILYYCYVLPLSNDKQCSLLEGCKTETIWQSIEKSDILTAKNEIANLIQRKFDYSIKTIHNYCQLQSCLYHLIQLKRLLIADDPISLPLILNGTVIHNITQKLKISPNPHNYINYVLGHKTFNLFLEIRGWLLSQVTDKNLCKFEYWW